MKYLFKKYWLVIVIAALINLPILIIGCIRTDKSVTLKGDTSVVSNAIEVESPYKSEGSFSTIYVISLDHSTILQNLLLENDITSLVEDIPSSYLHFTDIEMNQMGIIQYNSSIMYSTILAYEQAALVNNSIHIEYSFDAYLVSYYKATSDFRINDRIIGINNIYGKDDFNKFREVFNSMKPNDTIHLLRNGKETDIILNEKNYNSFSGYAYYNIDVENTYPSYQVNQTNVVGPSGGLLQTLSLYNSLIPEDITKGRKIAGTGTINVYGDVGAIGGIKQKIFTAYDDDIDVFLCPKANYEEALEAYNKLPNKERMKLYPVSTFEEALEVLGYE